MLIAVVPLVVAVVGALVYALSASTKTAELGRLAFGAGLLALVLALAHVTIRIG